MNKLRIFVLLFSVIMVAGCSSTPAPSINNDEDDYPFSDLIEVYYFHFTLRCVTCLTLEAKAKEYIETLYPNQVSTGLIKFRAMNLDEEETKPLAKRLGVNGQSLIIVKGKKKIDLTTEGFLYSMVKPEKFKEIINEKIDGLLIQ